MSEKNERCPLCGSAAQVVADQSRNFSMYCCPVCGNYQFSACDWTSSNQINFNHLASFLYYHRDKDGSAPITHYYTTLSSAVCDAETKEYAGCARRLPVHMDEEMVEAWFPRSVAERMDKILLRLNEKMEHVGQELTLTTQETFSLLFVDRRSAKTAFLLNNNNGRIELRNEDDCFHEAEFMLKALQKEEYISYTPKGGIFTISLCPAGYARIDFLQRHNSSGRTAFVAMKFGDDTIPLREAIRKGVSNAGYEAVFINEVEHNEFIVPEILKHIIDSKFIVVDLTHNNSGAYFEEGFALGKGKPVIQLCQEKADGGTGIHFDVAQKNTIIWKTEDDIPERLCNRIKATID